MRVVQILAGAVAALACATGAAWSASDPEAPAGPRIEGVESGMPSVSKEGRTLELTLQGWMEALRIPGVGVAIIDGYEIVAAKGYGVREAGAGGDPVTAKSLFQAASISKPIAALALLHHAGLGAFDLDQGINTYLQSWKLPDSEVAAVDRVTLRDLLAHSAGITPGGFVGYERGSAVPTLLQILEGTPPASNRPARILAVPGAEVSYSGLGYVMLQLALSEHLGKPFEEIIRASIFDPVGMDDSTLAQELTEALDARAARGHRADGEAIPGGWHVYPELAAAGMWSTPTDLAKLAIEVARSSSDRSHRILSHEMTLRMLTQHRDQMGLGFVIRPGSEHGWFAHSGGNPGYRCHFQMLAGTGQGVVIMTNSDVGGLIIPLITRSVARAYAWPVSEIRDLSAGSTEAIFTRIDEKVDQPASARKKIDVDEKVLKRYVGRYELGPGQVFEVDLSEGSLYVRLGDQPRFPVHPESESEFFYEVVDAQLTFVVDGTGRTTALILHQGGRDLEARRIE